LAFIRFEDSIKNTFTFLNRSNFCLGPYILILGLNIIIITNKLRIFRGRNVDEFSKAVNFHENKVNLLDERFEKFIIIAARFRDGIYQLLLQTSF
jgi:hypothetical protein